VPSEDEAPVTVDGESNTGTEGATPAASAPSTPMVQRATITIGGQVA
jgi:ParB family chromosome partitioning protein